ncbi:MAG: cohesin domain-containing protein, partial [Patescibacteria group bacterium]
MKKLIQLAMGILLLVALPITIFVAGQRQEIRKKAAPATTMAVAPASLSKKAGDVFTMEITIDTGENQVVAAELHITFDQTKLEAQTITNGSLFPNILASGTVEPGGASITVGAADAKQPVRGTGTVATVKFLAKEKTDSPSSIKLGSNSFVGGLGEGATNVLAGTTPASVTITKD